MWSLSGVLPLVRAVLIDLLKAGGLHVILSHVVTGLMPARSSGMLLDSSIALFATNLRELCPPLPGPSLSPLWYLKCGPLRLNNVQNTACSTTALVSSLASGLC